MKIQIKHATKNPLTYMGSVAAECYNTTDPKRFKGIGRNCLNERHSRVLEFPDILIIITGMSAKATRDLYTHQHTSKLQASTRYIDYSQMYDEIIPPSVLSNEDAVIKWQKHSASTQEVMQQLKEIGIPLEDYTGKLPLGYETTWVWKVNLSTLIHMFGVRACTRAYHEVRQFMSLLKNELSKIDDEWQEIAETAFHPRCVNMLYCPESKSRTCGMRPRKEDLLKVLEKEFECYKKEGVNG